MPLSRDFAVRLRTLLFAVLVSVLCYLAAKVSGFLVINTPQTLWPLWAGCAVLVAILLLSPRKLWPLLLFAGLAGFAIYDIQAGVPFGTILWLLLTDVVEILLTASGVLFSHQPSPPGQPQVPLQVRAHHRDP